MGQGPADRLRVDRPVDRLDVRRRSRRRAAPSAGRADGRASSACRVLVLRIAEHARRLADLDDPARGSSPRPGRRPRRAPRAGGRRTGSPRPSSSRRSRNRFSSCACTETSSALTASSAISTSGPTASARATATRWRWPPDSSRGRRSASARAQVDALERLADERVGVLAARALVDAPGLVQRRRRRSFAGSATRRGPGRPSASAGAARAARRPCAARTSMPSSAIGAGVGLDQPDDAARERRLAAARAAGEAEDLAAAQLERHVVDRAVRLRLQRGPRARRPSGAGRTP